MTYYDGDISSNETAITAPYDHVRNSLRDPVEPSSENEFWRNQVKRATKELEKLIRSKVPKSRRDQGLIDTLVLVLRKWALRRYSHSNVVMGAFEVTRSRKGKPKAEDGPVRTTRRHFKRLTKEGILYTQPEQVGGSILKEKGKVRQGKAALRTVNLEALALFIQGCELTVKQNNSLMNAIRKIKDAHLFADSERETEALALARSRNAKSCLTTKDQPSPKTAQAIGDAENKAHSTNADRVSRRGCHEGGSCHPSIKQGIEQEFMLQTQMQNILAHTDRTAAHVERDKGFPMIGCDKPQPTDQMAARVEREEFPSSIGSDRPQRFDDGAAQFDSEGDWESLPPWMDGTDWQSKPVSDLGKDFQAKQSSCRALQPNSDEHPNDQAERPARNASGGISHCLNPREAKEPVPTPSREPFDWKSHAAEAEARRREQFEQNNYVGVLQVAFAPYADEVPPDRVHAGRRAVP